MKLESRAECLFVSGLGTEGRSGPLSVFVYSLIDQSLIGIGFSNLKLHRIGKTVALVMHKFVEFSLPV